MKHKKLAKKFAFSFITVFILSIASLFSQELQNEFFVSAGVSSKNDSEEENKVTATWGYTHTADFWDFDAGVYMKEDFLSATGAVNIFSNYFKNWNIQPGTSLGVIYNIQYENSFISKNGFVSASFYIDVIPTKTRLTLYGGLGFNKGKNLNIDDYDPDFSVFPIMSLFLTQEIASVLELKLGIASFSFFAYQDNIKPQIFGNIAWNVTPQIAITSEFRVLYTEYKKDTPIEYDGFDFSAGIKYAY